jgi:acetyl esterase/lipase
MQPLTRCNQWVAGRFPLVLCLILAQMGMEAGRADDFIRTEDVIYGRRPGVALTLDVFQPSKTNGYGLAFMVSGGWFSSHESINPAFLKPFLDRGYTVFAVVHGSQPKYIVTEITEDIHRSIRFIRHNAAHYGIAADHLGILGASAGGHLSLTMGVHGGPGPQDDKDPVNRESSAVQAVACFFPPTDFLNYGKPEEDAVGVGILASFKPAFGPRSDTPEGRQSLGREISPIYHITTNLPPTLILHGDADTLVPIQQSQTFAAKAEALGAQVRLVVRAGEGHAVWKGFDKDLGLMADWFDQHLRGLPPK